MAHQKNGDIANEASAPQSEITLTILGCGMDKTLAATHLAIPQLFLISV